MSPESLLCDRKVELEEKTRRNERGTQSIKATAFADYTAIVTRGKTEDELRTNIRAAINTVLSWAEMAEIKLNADKTEVISAGQKEIAEVEIGERVIKTKPKLKYLGLWIDRGLRWKDHLNSLCAKTDRLLLRIGQACWSNGTIRLKEKIRLYKQVFEPMITYGYEIWFEEIRRKTTYVDRIIMLQRRVLRAITGAYKNVSTVKLFELTGVLPIETEMRIRSETRKIGRAERAGRRHELRMRWKNGRESVFEFSPNFEINEIRNRESIWCMTETGPFRRFLKKIGKLDDDTCRLCGLSAETAQHLLYECGRIPDEIALTNDYTTAKFETSCYKLIKYMKAIEL